MDVIKSNKCKYCDKKYVKSTNLKKHFDRCLYKIIFDKNIINQTLLEKNNHLEKHIQIIENSNISLKKKLNKSSQRINYLELQIDRLLNY